MDNIHSFAACEKATFSSHFKKPLYDSYCFSRIPDTIRKLCTGEGEKPLPSDVVGGSFEQYDTVILFLVDGFGWRFFNEFVDQYPFLQRFKKQGIVSKITSQFPSTTAAHITTLCTGQEVGTTGVYEWFYYEPLVDRMIAPLCFSFAGDHEMGTLASSKVSPQELFPKQTLYQSLKEKGVSSFVFQHEGIADSPYSNTLFSGAQIIPYQTCEKGLELLMEKAALPGKKYLYFYFGDIDAKGHRQGLYSPQFLETIDSFFKMMEEKVGDRLSSSSQKIATLLTADHGMVSVNPQTTIYLNRVLPDIMESFQTNKEGIPLVPAGSCRDFFLHILPEELPKIHEQLKKLLHGIAEVYLTEELIKFGFFGNVSPLFRARVGNLVILPYEDQSVWWFEKHRFEQHFKAAHGGLTPHEMESIFLFL